MNEEKITKTSICGIYKITCKDNGKVYIGSSNNIPIRWRQHLYLSKTRAEKLYKDMREYGLKSFSFEILIECEPEEKQKWESGFIKEYSSNNSDFGYNFNSK